MKICFRHLRKPLTGLLPGAFEANDFRTRPRIGDYNDLGAREGSLPDPLPPPLSPLRTNDAALTGTDFSVFSKGFAGWMRTAETQARSDFRL